MSKNDSFDDFKDEVCKDYAVKTQAEIDQILKDCAKIYIEDLKEKLRSKDGTNL